MIIRSKFKVFGGELEKNLLQLDLIPIAGHWLRDANAGILNSNGETPIQNDFLKWVHSKKNVEKTFSVWHCACCNTEMTLADSLYCESCGTNTEWYEKEKKFV